MPKLTEAEKDKMIRHVLAELAAGIPVSRTLGPQREQWLCCERTFWNWYYEADAEDENGLVQKVARARECGIEAKMDQAMHVAETPMIGTIKVDKVVNIGGSPMPVTEVRHEDMLGHRKLMVDTIIKQAQMLKPKTYGPKLDLTSAGDKLPGPTSEVDLATRMAALAASMNQKESD